MSVTKEAKEHLQSARSSVTEILDRMAGEDVSERDLPWLGAEAIAVSVLNVGEAICAELAAIRERLE